MARSEACRSGAPGERIGRQIPRIGHGAGGHQNLAGIEGGGRWLILVGVGLLDTFLLYRFFTVTLPRLKASDPEMAAALTDASPPGPVPLEAKG